MKKDTDYIIYVLQFLKNHIKEKNIFSTEKLHVWVDIFCFQ